MSAARTSLTELQTAIYQRLTSDTAFMMLVSGVFDFSAVPVDQAYPFVTIGDTTEGPLNVFGQRGYLSTLTIDIWDNSTGFKTCQTILAMLNSLIDQHTLSLSTHHHVYTLYDSAHQLNDPGRDSIRHMPVRYITFTQEGTGGIVTAQDVNVIEVNGNPLSSDNPVPVSDTATAAIQAGTGTTSDTTWSGSGAGTQIAILKKMVSLLTAALTVSGSVSVSNLPGTQPISGSVTSNAGTNTSTAALALETGGNLANIKIDTDNLVTSVGAVGDVAYSGSGNGSEIAILKKIVAELAATLTVSGNVGVSSLPSIPAGSALIGNVELVDSAGTNKAAISAGGAVKTDNSGVTQPVSGAFWQATQPVSNASLPLPTGASTSAKQPALGTAGSASSDVLSIQGVTSMTPIKTDSSGVTQPVSGTVTSNPTQSATSTLTNVIAATATTVILASNTSRKAAYIYNDSASALYLKFGATASTTSFTVKIGANVFYEMPTMLIYTGALNAVWDSATGTARCTELS